MCEFWTVAIGSEWLTFSEPTFSDNMGFSIDRFGGPTSREFIVCGEYNYSFDYAVSWV